MLPHRAILLASAAVAWATPAAQSAVSLSFSPPDQLVLREPVVIDLKIQNDLAQPVHVDLGLDRKENVALVVKRPDGSVVSPRLRFSDVVRVGRVRIAPDAQYSQRLLLNDWLRFDQLGSYLIEVRLTTPIKSGSGEVLNVPPSHVFSLHVGPRDDVALRQTCQRLADTVAHSQVSEDRIFAARALGTVADPVALPYVKKILASTELFDWILIDALRKWASPDAQTILEEMARVAGGDRSMLARSALGRPPRG